ncbi:MULTISPECIES: hypothetical protein [Sorangium]|uniref:Secreted protein n=1 Tax=Sorangium cellulosum (strain So ce56) TaxID=448385 RepID=A9ENB9_SORC5|nr:hypothetical protein [Sorangium cellulosum]CAN90841.1 hypothetical protein sce0684 [Sorangium cellulosum So ce56]
MMRALFASLSFSLLAGCAVTPAGEPAAEDLAPPDAVEQSAASDAVAFSSAVTFHSETPFYVPPRVGGDADFGGHGPRTYLEVELHVFNGNEVWASVHIDAIETKSDWTRAEGTGWFHLYTAPREITGILGPTYFEHEYLDTNHAHDLFSFSTGSLVSLLDYVGDTKGNEAGTRTGVQVFFQPITVGLL